MGEKLNVEETSAQGQVSPGQAQTMAGLSSKSMTPLKERGKEHLERDPYSEYPSKDRLPISSVYLPAL